MSLLVGRCQFSSRARCPRLPRGPSVYRLPQTKTQRHEPALKLYAQRPDQAVSDTETSLLSALTKVGFLGTIAVTGASLCGLKIFGYFQWNVSDILLALYLNSALLLWELLLFAPRWSIPASLVASGRQQFALNSDAQGLVDMSAITAGSVHSLQSWQLMLALYKAVLPRPLSHLPLLAQFGYFAALQVTRELFFRGFMVTALAGWMTDRCYEAGLNDVITVTPQLSLTLPQLGLWAAATVVTAVVAPAAAAVEAQEAVGEVSGALLLRTEIGQQLAAAKAGGSSSSSRISSTSRSSSSTPADVKQQQQDDLLQGQSVQEQQQPEAANREYDKDDDDDDAVLDPDVLEYRLIRFTEECVSSAPIRLAYDVTYVRGLARFILANVSFVATGGNLAATLSCALLLNGVHATAAVAHNDPQQQQP